MERICSKSDCNRRHYGRGLCKPHYLSAWSKGTHIEHPRELISIGASLAERLHHHGWQVSESGCWEWTGSKNGGCTVNSP